MSGLDSATTPAPAPPSTSKKPHDYITPPRDRHPRSRPRTPSPAQPRNDESIGADGRPTVNLPRCSTHSPEGTAP